MRARTSHDTQTRLGALGPPSLHLLIAGGFLCAMGAIGCVEESSPTEITQLEARESHRQLVRRLEDRVGAVIRRETRRRAWSTAIVEDLQKRETSDPERLSLQYRSLLERMYARDDYESRWIEVTRSGYRLSDSGQQLFEQLERGVEVHGLWPDDLHLPQLRKRLERHTSQSSRISFVRRPTLRERDRRALLEALSDREESLEGTAELRRVADLVADPEGPTPRWANLIADHTSEVRPRARRVAALELLLSDALAEYAIEMRYGNAAWHQPRAWRATFRLGETGPLRSVHLSGKPKEASTAAERMQRAVRTARTRTMTLEMLRDVWRRREPIERIMTELQPPYRQYERLTEAFRRYRPIVEKGGWPQVSHTLEQLGVGSSHPAVKALKTRLQLEGYLPDQTGAPTPRFTESLQSALETYQRTHQLWNVGQVTATTIQSLNVSAERRWHQLRVTLERWRNSRIGADRHYVHVNIPDFHAEVWREGTREMRFRVIVGEARTIRDDETGERTYPRSTPRFSNEIQYLVLNPYWNVPHGIWQNEIKPKKEKKPKYYEKNGYEVVTDDNGHKFLRQKPGPDNALGKVKFLFPNDHSVYMHDTDKPFLFQKPVRDYSHGCIRIAKPMEFMHYLLDLDGRWSGERRKKALEKWFDKKKEHWLRLRQPLPVHIEYYVVRVGEQGHAHFAADIYNLDQPRLERVDAKLQSLPGGYDLPQLSYEERLRAALDGRLDERS